MQPHAPRYPMDVTRRRLEAGREGRRMTRKRNTFFVKAEARDSVDGASYLHVVSTRWPITF